MKQSNISKYLFTLFVFGFLGFVVYLSFSDDKIEALASSEKSYKDSVFDYSIRYPVGMQFYKRGQAGEFQISNYDPFSFRGGHHFGDRRFKISTFVYENPSNLELEKWFLGLPVDSDFEVTINSITPINIGNKQGIRVNITDYLDITSESVFISFNDKVLEIGVIPVNTNSLGVFNKIINSFQQNTF